MATFYSRLFWHVISVNFPAKDKGIQPGWGIVAINNISLTNKNWCKMKDILNSNLKLKIVFIKPEESNMIDLKSKSGAFFL
jgi:predicted metalloprotease with PDZ domain